MSQIEKESLSALLDNEVDELELRRVLKSCEQDPALLETWERYNLVQSVLHASAVPVSANLSQRIAAQIEHEAPISSASKTARKWTNWQQSLTKVAIAASVAVAFMVGVQTNIQDSPAQTLVQQGELPTAANPATAGQFADIVVENVAFEVDPAAQQFLRKYIESITIDEEEPVLIEQLQDSPLFRLVNELQAKP